MPSPHRVKTPLAKNLIYYRKQSKLTQQALADILGITRSAYGYYEIDTAPPLPVLRKLAKIYGVSLDQLADGGERRQSGDGAAGAGGKETNPGDLIEANGDERALLYSFRLLNQSQKAQVQKIISSLINKLEP